MIDQIKLNKTKEIKTLDKNFTLSGLGNLTIITGENSVGKTNFMNVVSGLKDVVFLDENKKEIEMLEDQVIYIKAENIEPSKDVFAYTKDATWLLDNLEKLISLLDIKLEIKDEHEQDVINILKELENKTNKNISLFSGSDNHNCLINKKVFKKENGKEKIKLGAKVILRALIDNIEVKEFGRKDNSKLNELGQGMQRIIVVSVLKAYVDILLSRKKLIDKQILILFEEPEIYLHPKLKRSLNATLEKIASLSKHQVIITTHDPYFVFPPFDSDLNKKTYSFEKNLKGLTKILDEGLINGIEDELLFVFLYSRLRKNDRKRIIIKEISKKQYKNDKGEVVSKSKCCDLEYIRHQIHHAGENPNTFRCGVTREDEIEKVITEGKNFYTQEELSEAIKQMSKFLA